MFCCKCKRDFRNILMILVLTILDYDQTWCSSGLSQLMLEVLKVVKEFYGQRVGCLWPLFFLSRWSDDMKDLKRFSLWTISNCLFCKSCFVVVGGQTAVLHSTCTRTSMKRQNLIHSWTTHLERSAVLGTINSFKWQQLRNTNWTRL